jgi:hypothetical protein
MDGPIRCSSLTLEREEHLKMQFFILNWEWECTVSIVCQCLTCLIYYLIKAYSPPPPSLHVGYARVKLLHLKMPVNVYKKKKT